MQASIGQIIYAQNATNQGLGLEACILPLTVKLHNFDVGFPARPENLIPDGIPYFVMDAANIESLHAYLPTQWPGSPAIPIELECSGEWDFTWRCHLVDRDGVDALISNHEGKSPIVIALGLCPATLGARGTEERCFGGTSASCCGVWSGDVISTQET